MKLPSNALPFAGYALENCKGRASSAVQEFDSLTMRRKTSSGRGYQLQQPPGRDPDGDYLWRCWADINNEPAW